MRAILVLAAKDLRLLLADKVGFFFVLIWPLLFASFFGFVIGGMQQANRTRPIPVVVHDADQTAGSQEFVARLEGKSGLKIDLAPDRADAEQAVLRGRRVAAVLLPTGFGAASRRIFGDPLQIEVVVDPSRAMESGLLQGLLQGTMFEHFQSSLMRRDVLEDNLDRAADSLAAADDGAVDPVQRAVLSTLIGGSRRYLDILWPAAPATDPNVAPDATATAPASAPANPLAGWRPFEVTVTKATELAGAAPSGAPRHRHSAFSFVFPQGIAWGVMACAATFALSMVVERTRGTLPRLLAAPLGRWQILAGKATACFAATTLVMLVLLLIARFAFGVHPNSLPLLALAAVCIAIAVVGVMMLLSVIGRTEAAVGGGGWAILILMAMFGGGMIPLSQLSGWMVTVSYFSIFRWTIEALDGAIWRNFTLVQMLPACAILLATGVVGFGLGTTVFRTTERR